MARVVVPGIPLHLTHRGNRRGDVFFCDEDRERYLASLSEQSRRHGVKVWGWCLMRNHIHLIAVPGDESALVRVMNVVQSGHSRRLNASRGWTGHVWANRYFSTALDEIHLWEAIRYIENNPVRAGLVDRAQDWAWSSAAAHVRGQSAAPLDPQRPFLRGARDAATGRRAPWAQWLAQGVADQEARAIRQATQTGRPLGSDAFIADLEARCGRSLRPQKRGRKPKGKLSDDKSDDMFGAN